jgi:transcriptional regulator with XRE-family HTH domain
VSHPLVRTLKQVRNAHNVSQEQLNDCMLLPKNTYRHIERGRRQLPDLQHKLAEWVQTFEDCVHATTEERQLILKTLSAYILELLYPLLPDGK